MLGLALGALGGLMQGLGARQQVGAQNRIYRNAASQFGPDSLTTRMRQLDPYLMNALMGINPGSGGSGYAQSLYNIAQNPGYLDPQLWNAPDMNLVRGGQAALQHASAMMGRGGMPTGMGALFAFANQANTVNQRAQLSQQQAMAREQQRRADLQWLQQAYNQNMAQAYQGAQGQAQMLGQQQASPNWWSIGGNMLGAGMQGYGLQQMFGQQKPKVGAPYQTWGPMNNAGAMVSYPWTLMPK